MKSRAVYGKEAVGNGDDAAEKLREALTQLWVLTPAPNIGHKRMLGHLSKVDKKVILLTFVLSPNELSSDFSAYH